MLNPAIVFYMFIKCINSFCILPFYFVFQHFVESAKRNIAPQIDVYDAATWLAITPLSEASIATGSSPQAFPDFTRGRWTDRKPDFASGDEF